MIVNLKGVVTEIRGFRPAQGEERSGQMVVFDGQVSNKIYLKGAALDDYHRGEVVDLMVDVSAGQKGLNVQIVDIKLPDMNALARVLCPDVYTAVNNGPNPNKSAA